MWQEKIIFIQHSVNESCIYLTCLFLVFFTPISADETNLRVYVGRAFLVMLALLILFNISVIFVMTWRQCCLLSRRPSQIIPEQSVTENALLSKHDLLKHRALMRLGKQLVADEIISEEEEESESSDSRRSERHDEYVS